ncbi:pentapeptide repeat-containing protein [Paenibacillus pasadenensis]|uniref:pentapeptide repeat-containing protein n=1 Tax=Paenibacillus pasadenensis TaxID=217090 RepID=UPI00203D5B43|nr:pentapeptide repeat-containing protein [Paenibacillus pasadenensis]MCM3748624.1 pentapeptide repeat-containing protein [Paenibacillus pasadenensis]
MSEGRKRLKLETPRLPGELSELTLPAAFGTREMFESGLVEEQRIEELEASRVVFDGVKFRHVTFSSVKLQEIELTDVVFEKCDLSNVDLSGAVIHRAEFRSCKMLGVDLSDCTLRNILFEDCLLDYANFRASTAKGIVYADSSMNSSDFGMSKLSKTEFHRCKLDRAQLGTELKGIDLSDCEFNSLAARPEDLRGCIISREQAFIVAGIFGLVVKE